jgi:hypothetical protein
MGRLFPQQTTQNCTLLLAVPSLTTEDFSCEVQEEHRQLWELFKKTQAATSLASSPEGMMLVSLEAWSI